MVDFGALPPEINSARMYAGPGSSSFQVAASAWNGLAAELQSAAQGYETTITQLASDEWNGPASAAMASAAQPYISWMQETAAQAEQAATQAQAAAAAYEQAFAATVAPPLIAANRAQTAAAVQANVFGQYTALSAQLSGNLRHTHSRLAEFAEEIAFFGGEGTEKMLVEREYAGLVKHENSVLRRRRWHGCVEEGIVKWLWGSFGVSIERQIRHSTGRERRLTPAVHYSCVYALSLCFSSSRVLPRSTWVAGLKVRSEC